MPKAHPLRRALALGALLTSSGVQDALARPQLAARNDHSVPTLAADYQVQNEVDLALVKDDGEVYFVPWQALTAMKHTVVDGTSTIVTTTIKQTPANKAVVNTSRRESTTTTTRTVSSNINNKKRTLDKRATTSSSTKSTTKPSTSTTTSVRTSTTTVASSASLTSLDTSDVQTATKTNALVTTGSLNVALETSGEPAKQPFATSDISSPTSSISIINTKTTNLPNVRIAAVTTSLSVPNIFVRVATGAPPSQIPRRTDHPVKCLGCRSQNTKLQTNSFYANFFLGSQSQGTWVHPYLLTWSKGGGPLKSWGMSVSNAERNQVGYGPGNPAQYFINPLGLQPIVFSASELGSSTSLTIDTMWKTSANVNLAAKAGATPLITFPLVQGMGFVTALYKAATPWIQSSVSVAKLTYIGKINSNRTFKYTALLADGFTWMIYVTPNDSNYAGNTFTLTNANRITGKKFTGTIQVAKIPASNTGAQAIYDSSAGTYATLVTIGGSVNGNTGTYTMTWTKGGTTSQKLLMFALPHHQQSLTSGGTTSIKLQTTTKGLATAVLANSWTLTERNLPINMGFSPYLPTSGSIDAVSAAAMKLINKAGASELSQDMAAQTNLNSMYYSGKGLAKFAAIVLAVHDFGKNTTLAYSGLVKLQKAFNTFVQNKQVYPLYYESQWGGVVSSSTYLDTSPNSFNNDFGNTYYNDHHFHYSYFVYAAAVIGYLDPAWLTNANKAWVNTLIRDYANPVSDSYFPFSRGFDWYHGHSWAKGLFESADGKDQESSSEDSNAAYAIKMWGKTVGDKPMEARGNVMLAIQARSAQNYFLYNSNNTVQPANFIGNKVSGILFENKIDHVTYFGTNIEYIQGIQMIPILPYSALTRTKSFVTQEWNTFFANGYPATLNSGWRGILMANLAIIQPKVAYNFFASSSFDNNWLDGGASLTWYLTYSAALGGSPATASKRDVEAAPQGLLKRAGEGLLKLVRGN